MKMWQQVLIGMVLGILVGFALRNSGMAPEEIKSHANNIKIMGVLFIDLIKMIIVPLIVLALISGITSMTDPATFTRVGLKGILFYMCTAMFAVLIGITFGTLFAPGVGIDMSTAASASATVATKTPPTLGEFMLSLISTNIIRSMAEDQFIQVVIFSVFAGVVLNRLGDKCKELREVLHQAAKLVFRMIELIVKLAPIAAFAFLAWMVATQGSDVIMSLGKLVAAVLSACLFQYLLFGVMLKVFGGLNPLPFYKKLLATQSLAFATSSSKATLSTAMREVQEKLGVSERSSNFLLPLGAATNMDGTAIYLGICALFFSQAYGIPLEAHHYFVLVLTCTLGSIGAAGIPSGSIIFMGMVLSSVGLPIEGIGIILGVDRVLDMFRTTINITGDCAITTIVDSSEGTLNKAVYNSKAT